MHLAVHCCVQNAEELAEQLNAAVSNPAPKLEGWESGRIQTPRKRPGSNASQVRILLLPPLIIFWCGTNPVCFV